MQYDPFTALYEYYQTMLKRGDNPNITPYGWTYRPVSHEVIIGLDGELVDIRRVGHKKKESEKWENAEYLLPVQPVRSGTNPPPAFLADSPAYVCGKYMVGYRSKWESLAALVPECKELRAVLKFYERYTSSELMANPKVQECLAASSSGSLVFRIANGRAIHEIPEVVNAVNTQINQALDGQPRCICRLSGEEDAICRIWHPWRDIKDSGSFGLLPTYYMAESSQRYGYQQGENALVGVHSEWAVWQAWKSLSKNAVFLGDTTYVYWADDGSTPNCIASLFRAIQQGGGYVSDSEDGDPNCYVLGVQKAGTRGLRVVVFLYAKLSVFERNIKMVGELAELMGIEDEWRLIDIIHALNEYRNPNDTVRRFDEGKIRHYWGAELLDMVCTGRKITETWLSDVMTKYLQLVRKGYSCNYGSMRWLSVLLAYGLCKMGKEQTEDWSKTMNEVIDDKMAVYKDNPYWLLGRLIACVERMQECAVYGPKGSNKGNIYRRILPRAIHNPMEAFQTVGNWYESKYYQTGIRRCGGLAGVVHKEYQTVMDKMGGLLDTRKPSSMDKACLLLGFRSQMTAFFRSRGKEGTDDVKTDE